MSGSSCPEAATCLLAALGAGGLAALLPAATQADQVELHSWLVLLVWPVGAEPDGGPGRAGGGPAPRPAGRRPGRAAQAAAAAGRPAAARGAQPAGQAAPALPPSPGRHNTSSLSNVVKCFSVS